MKEGFTYKEYQNESEFEEENDELIQNNINIKEI